MPLEVVTSGTWPVVMTIDEQGRAFRSLHNLILHAANRHAAQYGGKFYLGNGA